MQRVNGCTTFSRGTTHTVAGRHYPPVKDNIDTADFPTTGGTPGLAAHRPKRNATIVQQLLDAGAWC
jgi:Asp-tRNA(Asn)/Glu-tRNA(Gln) amidotransferase A subunit family amidase